jgi:hypothetical protein
MPPDELSLYSGTAGALSGGELRLSDEGGGGDVIVGCLLWDCVLPFVLMIGSREELKGRCLSVCALWFVRKQEEAAALFLIMDEETRVEEKTSSRSSIHETRPCRPPGPSPPRL